MKTELRPDLVFCKSGSNEFLLNKTDLTCIFVETNNDSAHTKRETLQRFCALRGLLLDMSFCPSISSGNSIIEGKTLVRLRYNSFAGAFVWFGAFIQSPFPVRQKFSNGSLSETFENMQPNVVWIENIDHTILAKF